MFQHSIKTIAIAFVICFASLIAQAETPEKVIDQSGVLTQEQIASITEYHSKLLEVYHLDYRVLVSGDEGDIDLFANKYFNDTHIGSDSTQGWGMLLVVNPKQNLVRLEISKGLEAVYTDAFVSYIEHRQMIPFFKAGQVANGILATTELMFARAKDAVDGKEFDENIAAGSAGGGVSNKAEIGGGADEKSKKTMAPLKPGQSPAQVVVAYLNAMSDRNSNPDLPIYSAATKEMQKNWVVTAAQMDMVVNTFKSCKYDRTLIEGSFAVVRYALDQRLCSPYFLVMEDGMWKLDLTMMMHGIRFNHMNEWHFDRSVNHPYWFAFNDWELDNNGYPQRQIKLRWYLGVTTYRMSVRADDLATFIDYVGKDSPAEKLGLMTGDRVLKWNDIENPYYTQIVYAMDHAAPGDAVTVLVDRQGQTLTITGVAPPMP